jgi:hypothetical protein
MEITRQRLFDDPRTIWKENGSSKVEIELEKYQSHF